MQCIFKGVEGSFLLLAAFNYIIHKYALHTLMSDTPPPHPHPLIYFIFPSFAYISKINNTVYVLYKAYGKEWHILTDLL